MIVKTDEVTTASKGDVFFGAKHQERLSCRTVQEAILEQIAGWSCRAVAPDILDMVQYSREQVSDIFFYEPLERLMESLEEDYGDSEMEREPVTEKMREAEKAFLAVVLEEYVPFLVQRDFDFGLVFLQPAGECCTFLRGCCLNDRRQVICNWHEGRRNGV